MSEDFVVNLTNIEKVYKLYSNSSQRLKEALHPLRRKYHSEFFALRGVSLKVRKGETIGIIGKNGSGKSTLLKVLAGVLTPTSGLVQIQGRVSALLELGAGFSPEMTGIENVFFHGMLLGYSREEMKKKLNSILEFADLGDFIYQPVKTYSSGMFVRLAFAVSVSVDPDILIVDEALAVGDMAFQKKCLERIDTFKKMGKTILFCGHDMHTVNSLCDRVLWIKEGQVAISGEASEVISEYVAWMTRASGEVKGDKSGIQKISVNHYIRNSDVVEILSVRSTNSNGDEEKVFMEGKNVYFEVLYDAKTSIEDPNYSYIVFDQNKSPVAIGKRSFDTSISEVVNGQVLVKFFLEKIPFNRGSYTLGFSVWDKFNKIVFANNITCDFEVKTLKVTFGPTEERCVFFPQTNWIGKGV